MSSKRTCREYRQTSCLVPLLQAVRFKAGLTPAATTTPAFVLSAAPHQGGLVLTGNIEQQVPWFFGSGSGDMRFRMQEKGTELPLAPVMALAGCGGVGVH